MIRDIKYVGFGDEIRCVVIVDRECYGVWLKEEAKINFTLKDISIYYRRALMLSITK